MASSYALMTTSGHFSSLAFATIRRFVARRIQFVANLAALAYLD